MRRAIDRYLLEKRLLMTNSGTALTATISLSGQYTHQGTMTAMYVPMLTTNISPNDENGGYRQIAGALTATALIANGREGHGKPLQVPVEIAANFGLHAQRGGLSTGAEHQAASMIPSTSTSAPSARTPCGSWCMTGPSTTCRTTSGTVMNAAVPPAAATSIPAICRW
jgi:hypothetical protein